MTIGSGDVKIFKSVVMSDTTDGGGQMSPNLVQDGVSNNIFPDISELDRVFGRVSMRKTFASVDVLGTDMYFGSNAIITKIPDDSKVNVCLFSTKDWFDRRSDAVNRVEQYLAPATQWSGHILENQLIGQRMIQLSLRAGEALPKVGQGLYLIENEGKSTEYSQYVRVTKTTSEERAFVVNGNDVYRTVATVEISDPLRYNFHGLTVKQYYNDSIPPAVCRDTRVANTATYYGAAKLKQAATLGSTSVSATSIFTQLVPSAQSETPIVDQSAGGLASLFVPTNTTTISYDQVLTIAPSAKVFLGTPILPSTLQLNFGGYNVTDSAGTLLLGTTDIGTVDYAKSSLAFNSAAPTYGSHVQVTFQPAAAPNKVADTAAISITQINQGYNYVMTITPPPQPASLAVSFTAQGKVYYLYDNGAGGLKGSDSSFGAGTVNYVTGSVIVTCGALPDADSELIFAWGKAVTTTPHADMAIAPIHYTIQLEKQQVTPSTIEILWEVGGVMKSATDNGAGYLQGDAVGTVDYATGKIKFIPALMLAKGAELTIDYLWGESEMVQIDAPITSLDGKVHINLHDLATITGDIRHKSVKVEWVVNVLDPSKLTEIFQGQVFDPPPLLYKKTPLVTITDDGLGTFKRQDGTTQPLTTIDYVTGEIVLNPLYPLTVPKPTYTLAKTGEIYGGALFPALATPIQVPMWRYTQAGWENLQLDGNLPNDNSGYIIVRYRVDSASTTKTETITLNDARIDLTPKFGESIVRDATRFIVGNLTYIDRQGSLYHSVAPATGAATLAGSLEYSTGIAVLTDWQTGANNGVTLQALATEKNLQTVEEVVFRIPVSPIRPNSVQIRAVPIVGSDGQAVSVTADANGRILSSNMVGTVDYTSGIVRIKFGNKRNYTPADSTAPWFNSESIVTEGGVQKIIEPIPVYADTILYNAVGYTYIPLSADIIGLDAVRLPTDGRVPIFNVGGAAVVHNTNTTAFPSNATQGTTLNVGRVRVSTLQVYDANDTPLDTNMYTTNLDAGTVTLNNNFSIGSLVPPLKAVDRIEDMGLVIGVEINGTLTFSKPLTHDYPVENSLVSSALVFGDLQSRVYNKFSQVTWSNQWSDNIIGDETTAQYNDTVYPLVVQNRGATQERWACIFTGTTTFRVVGENTGQIATGNINTELAPLNPATGTPYFTIDPLGWGGGWAAGNVLRFNTAAANAPFWVVRTVLQGNSDYTSDGFKLQIRGDIDR